MLHQVMSAEGCDPSFIRTYVKNRFFTNEETLYHKYARRFQTGDSLLEEFYNLLYYLVLNIYPCPYFKTLIQISENLKG